MLKLNARRARIAGILGATALACGAFADPPVAPPCDLIVDPVFCIRVTDIVKSPGIDDRFLIELMFVNWTGDDVAGIVLTLNTGANPGEVPPGAPFFCNQFVDATCQGPSIDVNGRPIGPMAMLPLGNQPTNNDWSVIDFSPTMICYSAGTPIPHPTAFGFDGLADPDFANSTATVCGNAFEAMIPGSKYQVEPTRRVIIPDAETVDNGDNVLDGFVFEVADWDEGEQLSFNWHFIDSDGNNIGIVSPSGPTMGNPYGFGTFNFAMIPSSRGVNFAPPPLFNLNTGYDPESDADDDLDSPLFWAENQRRGEDFYPINPIPAGRPGQGTWFAVEPGATITAEFANPEDNDFMFRGERVMSGVNVVFGCAADWNGDGQANSDDFFDFLQDFLRGEADFNGDGRTDSDDFFEFFTVFLRDC